MKPAKPLLSLAFAGCLVMAAMVVATAWAAPRGKQAWQDDFNGTSLDPGRWVVVSGNAPGYIANNHRGFFQPDRVSVANGYLVLKLTQEYGTVDGNSSGSISRGGAIYSKATYGYGTYEWHMRMSSTATAYNGGGIPVSGSISAGFNYVNDSQTEIDFEFAGNFPNRVYMVNWKNSDPSRDPAPTDSTYSIADVTGISDVFHTFKYVWERGRISYYVDGVLKATHTTNVPTAAAYFMINHWGANSPSFGGLATPGVTRCFYVDWVRYTPPR